MTLCEARAYVGPKECRRITTRYEKTAVAFLGFHNIAPSHLWLKHCVNKPWSEEK
jgi:transposase